MTHVRPAPARPSRRHRVVASRLLAAVSMLAAGMSAAQAQTTRSVLDTGIPFDLPQTDRVTVLQRPHPEVDALGVHAGAFLVFPQIELAANATNNVFGATTDTNSDVYATVAPRIDARSDWSRHQLQAHARGTFRRYLDYSIKNENGYDVGVDGRLDIVGDSNLRAAVNADRIYITQLSGDFPRFAAASVPLDRQVASLRGTYAFNRLQLIGDVNVTRLNYSDTRALDGTLIDQDYLDRTATRLTARAEYNVSPVTSLFVQGIYTLHNYRVTNFDFDRSGDEVRVIGGAAFDVTPLIRTRLGVGYLTRHYDTAGVGNLSGLALDAQVDYLITELTTISLSARRDVRDAIVTGSPGYVASRVSAEIDHELLRNLILIGRADVEKDDFSRIDRDDTLFHVGASALYTLNRSMVLTPSIDYSNRDSRGAQIGQRFNEVRAGLSLTLRR
ncbi:outer membrane beta-barrel protein [Sphingomonas phyllosphaerae]|uniref:outer membrane beta-barrel protein n=1 Tax=Sphingomonas phyllosphaerae TaxID=257003 RepID=UPI0009DC135F|nr:outer membrane beta-barrel protein [Sphingomonas phyllosphaerae]